MKFFKIFLLISWMIIIFSFSNDTATVSSKKSDSFIIKTIELFTRKELSLKEKEFYIKHLVYYVRKLAHMGIYFILGILVIWNLKDYVVFNYKIIIFSLFLCFLYACSDEFHQLFVQGRSGEVFDVIIDSIGSFMGIYIYYLFNIRKVIKYE